MMTLAVVSHPAKALAVMRWAARCAHHRDGGLIILCCEFDGAEKLPASIDENSVPNEPPIIRKAREAAGEFDEVTVEILAMSHPRPTRIIADYIEKEEDFGLLIVSDDYESGRDDPGNRLARYLLQFAPCDILALDPGDRDGTSCQQILVPLGMRLESFVLKTAIGFPP
jgi:hypothetical protein